MNDTTWPLRSIRPLRRLCRAACARYEVFRINAALADVRAYKASLAKLPEQIALHERVISQRRAQLAQLQEPRA